jgi:hypothetical protein
MSSKHLTLPEIISELRSLTSSKATGTFYIVSDCKHSAMFGLENGRLVTLQCRLRFGEKAIPLIAGIKQGSCRFDNTLGIIRKMDTPNNEEVFLRILSAAEKNKASNSASTPKEDKPRFKPFPKYPEISITQDQKKKIREILNEEMGPMGNLVIKSIEKCANFREIASVLKENSDGLDIEKSLTRKIRTVLKC